MNNCKISIWNNTWSDQFDFTVNKSKCNFSLIDDDAYDFIDSYKTTVKHVMQVQAKEVNSLLDVSDIKINVGEEEQLPVVPITTGNIAKPARVNIFALFHASDSDTVHKIYHNLYKTYFKGRRDEYWLKYTREVLLNQHQLMEVLNCDTSDPEYNKGFYEDAMNKPLIGMHICAAKECDLAQEIEDYLVEHHEELEFYVSSQNEPVDVQSTKFFKEYNKEDRGQKIN
eukprot:CAMPEP_0168317770 /NCGR_PEP_ID=MMETSP0213-20121227/86_1 /TAXON_ID=151035 /ORGANISM="Euplotes harpa, Strain FSP1.4" /LENGTH=226 /DNA_ID=CAMNT_0008318719 /DNA_START=613 /DNA_END=1293 /DNA_ORIENTATION=-